MCLGHKINAVAVRWFRSEGCPAEVGGVFVVCLRMDGASTAAAGPPPAPPLSLDWKFHPPDGIFPALVYIFVFIGEHTGGRL